jgi:hypothetical protein
MINVIISYDSPLFFYAPYLGIGLMNKTVLMATTLSALFAVSMFSFAFAAGHLTIVDSSVEQQGTYTATVQVSANIPIDGSGDNFGYAWFTDNGALVATSHPIAVDSVGQHSDEDFHTHLVQLGNTPDCASDLAVDSLTKREVGRTSIDGDTLTINNIPSGQTGVVADGALAFTLTVENDRVCVNPQ